MQSVLQDLRHAARGLARNFRFTATVVFTLALGIGATTAIFTVVRSVLLNPLAYADADRLVAVFTRDTRGGGERAPSSPANFLDWKEHSGVFDHLTAASPWAPTLTGWDNPDQIEGLRASPALFDLLGVSPAMGRTFTAAGENSEDPRVVVLGHALWQRRFGADPQIVGKVLTLDREPYTVIGVMPPGFRFPPFWATDAEFWSPLVFTPQQTAQRRAQFLRVLGRLKPGFSLDQARAAMNTLAGRLAEQYPDSNRNLSVNVEPLKEPVVSGVRTSLLVLMGAVGLVLLIGCANVASLLLARGAGRGREVAVRLALGASRRRVVGQFLAESSLLALAGGAGGLALAAGGLDALVALGSGSVPRLQEVSMDGAILAFALGVSVLTGLGFGVAPALRASDLNLNEALKQGSRSASGSSTRAHNLLVAGEMALALLLLVGAGLLLQTFWNLRTLDPGFRTQNLLTASLPFAGSSHTTPAAQQALFDEILRRVHALPGVESAALVNHIPVGGDQWGSRFQAEGSIFTTLDDLPRVSFRVATPGYFRTMGTPILRGREFSEHDTADGNRVVVVNETFARTMWPNDDPVGQRIREGAPDWGRPWMTVVGVARDVRQWELTDTIPPEVYYPYSQNPVAWHHSTTLVVYTPAGASGLLRTVQSAVWAVDSTLPVARVRTMETLLAVAMQEQRLYAALLAAFAAVALTLSAVGVYGVMSWWVAARTREIGIRMALGAGRANILRLVLARGIALAAIGAAVGLAGAAALARILQTLLFGVSATDPVIYAGVTLLLTVVAVLATYIPARRAMRVDPVIALRYE